VIFVKERSLEVYQDIIYSVSIKEDQKMYFWSSFMIS